MKSTTSKLLLLLVIILGVLLIIQCSFCNEKLEDPKGLISKEESMKMKELYLKNQFNFINIGFQSEYQSEIPDFNGVTFELQEIKKYVYKIEQYAKEHGYKNLALRVEFGAKLDENNIPRSNIFFKPLFVPDSIPVGFPIPIEDYSDMGGIMDLNKGNASTTIVGKGNQ